MAGGGQVLKRVPRIKFPQRHKTSSSSSQGATFTKSELAETHLISMSRSDVPLAPKNVAEGGKASLQPKRTPVSDREIEAIMLGGCI